MKVQEPNIQVQKSVIRKTRDKENYEYKKVAKSNYTYTEPIMDVVGDSEP